MHSRHLSAPAFAAIAFSATLLLLTGCGFDSPASPSATPLPGVSLRGNVHGGQQPVIGAHVYLFAANTTGYGSASVSLLSSASTGNSDSVGAYVLTDPTGAFSISGDYTCTANTQVYLYALGGNPGAGVNSAAAFLTLVGNCPAAGNFAATVPFVWMNEVSTVAAAYAFSGWAADATHVSANGSTVAKSGLANAFANATNLANVATGVALATTPAGNGTVPLATIDTLANILASCVNSTGPGSSACAALFSNATADGTPSGASPTDTATAALYIAHNPSANVAALYAIPAPAVAFSPALTAQPNDFTLSLAFTGGGATSVGHLAIDASGDVWGSAYTRIAELSPLGVAISPTAGFTDTSLTGATGLAFDLSGDLWAMNQNAAVLSEFNSAGSILRTSTVPHPGARVAIDSSGDLWVPNYTSAAPEVTKLSSTGASMGNFNGGSIDNPYAIAIDPSGNVWVSNSGSTTGLTEFNSAGTVNASSPFNVAGITASSSLAIDSSSNVWAIDNSGNVSAMSSSGTALTGSPFHAVSGSAQIALAIDGQNHIFALTNVTGSGPFGDPVTTYSLFALDDAGNTLGSLTAPSGVTDLAIDSAGNLWLSTNSGIVEVVGVAAPVTTPLAVAVQNSCLGQRPCVGRLL